MMNRLPMTRQVTVDRRRTEAEAEAKANAGTQRKALRKRPRRHRLQHARLTASVHSLLAHAHS
jgi:hypothetical protein